MPSDELDRRFDNLQRRLVHQFEWDFPDPMAPKTVVIVPSLTLDPEILDKLTGQIHYEERLLCLLLLLRMPRTHIIYLSSMPIDEVIVDYYLHLLPGITGMHARSRLHMMSPYDASNKPLTQKILDRPRLLDRIRQNILPDSAAHLACFNITEHEQHLALALDVPLYGCPHRLNWWGSKSGSRELFREAGLLYPVGYENLTDMQGVAEALSTLHRDFPHIRKAVVKLNDGFSGDGNALFRFPDADTVTEDDLRTGLCMVAPDMTYEVYAQKMQLMGGIVEAFVEGDLKTSPSVQCRITPTGALEVISTHDQILGGDCGQVYLGACFPADTEYSAALGEIGLKISEVLRAKGVLGRFGIDFVSVKKPHGWEHYAIEINLRKGGTTHPYLMLQFLTDGHYDHPSGKFIMPNGQTRFYIATDGLKNDAYRRLTPEDLIDVSICRQVHFDHTIQEGVVFHLVGAISAYGKLGLVAIGSSPERAQMYYEKAVAVLNAECGIRNGE
ncbi:MAG: ATP-grasp domain-containing protein [Saprospiraceae bacterium]|nr:ATP-grasp domain-containing protein [Saprospiraceae bacterium]